MVKKSELVNKSDKKVDAPKKAAKVVKKSAKPRAIGRPTKFTRKLADDICAGLAVGLSVRTVLDVANPDNKRMPAMSTFFKWLRLYPEFAEQYARAKQESADAMAEEILDIADDGRNDWMEKHDKDGNLIGYMLNGEHVQRSRLRVDTRKFLMAKMKPKVYGDRVDITSKDEKIGVSLSAEQAEQLIRARADSRDT